MTLLIDGGLVVRSLWPPVVEQADVVIDAERVLAVGHCLSAGGQRIDASGCLVMPGNVNAHMHAYSALSRGMPYALEPPANFLEILQRVWWRLDRALDAGFDPRLGPGRGARSVARGHDHADRPSRLAQRDRRLARCPGRRLRARSGCAPSCATRSATATARSAPRGRWTRTNASSAVTPAHRCA